MVAGLAACSIERAHVASQAQTSMVGLTKEQVLACMGPPAQQQQVGQTEVWSYPSGGDSASFGSASAVTNGGVAYGNGYASGSAYTSAFGSSATIHKYCIVNVVMTNDHVQ